MPFQNEIMTDKWVVYGHRRHVMMGLAVIFGMAVLSLNGQAHPESLSSRCERSVNHTTLLIRSASAHDCAESTVEGRPRLIKNQDGDKVDGSHNAMREVQTKHYRFMVPSDWKTGTKSVEESLKQRMIQPGLASGKEPFRKNIQQLGVETTPLAILTSAVNYCSFVVSKTDLASGVLNEDKYMDKLRQQTAVKLAMGIKEGIVKEVIDNRRVNLKSGAAWLLDWEEAIGGSRHARMWVIHTKERPHEILTFSSFCNKEGYEAQKERFDKAAASATAANIPVPVYR